MNDISKRLAGETDNTVVTIIPIHNNLDQTEGLTDQARTKALKAMTFAADRRGRVVNESTVSVKRFDGGSIAGVDLEEREMYALRFAADTGPSCGLPRRSR